MIQFRQKEFVAPLAALGTAAMVASVPLTIGGMVQTSNESKKTAEQAKAQEAQMKQQNRLLKRIAENSQNNSQAATQAAEVIGQRHMSLVVKRFAAIPAGATNAAPKLLTWNNVKGLGKDLWKFTKAHKEPVVGGLVMGGTIGASGYLANKGVELDMKRSGIPLPKPNNKPEQKQYAVNPNMMKIGGSVIRGAKEWGGAAWKYAKSNPKSMALMATMGSAPTVLGYAAEKSQLKEQAKQTANANAPHFQQKEYGLNFMGTSRGIIKGSRGFVKGAKNFFKNPISTTAGGISKFTGTGGKKGLDNFTKELGKSSNPLTQKVGEFIGNHKTLGLVGSAGVGVGLWNTWGVGENAVKKTAKAIDKNAYAYDESKNQKVE